MGVKKLVSRAVRHERRKRKDKAEFAEVGSITDDSLRREVGSLIKDLKVVDGNYLRFVKKHSRFGKEGGLSEYNKKMLEQARTERVREQIHRYQDAMRGGVTAMGVARIVGHVAINAVFNKQYRNDFLDQFKKPIRRAAETLAKAGGQASITGRLMSGSTHVPFDARSAALTELAQTMKFNEDMRNTKDPGKREWLTKSYTESLNALYKWAGEDGVSASSIRRMRNVIIDKDMRSTNPKFAHLYQGLEFAERDSQRAELFEHLDEGTVVWEGDLKDSRTGKPFAMIVNAPEYGEPIKENQIDNIDDLNIDVYSDDKAVEDEAMAVSKLETEGYEFTIEDNEKRPERIDEKNPDAEPEEIVFEWSEAQNRAMSPNEVKQQAAQEAAKPERSLEIGSWDDVAREVVKRRVPDAIVHDIIEQRFAPVIEKAVWERVVESLTNQAEKPAVHLNGRFVYGDGGYGSTERLQRQAEYQLVNDAFNKHLDKSLSVPNSSIETKNDGYNRLDLDTNTMQVTVNYVTRERTRRQEREIVFEEMKEKLGKEAASTPSLSDDELLAKLELTNAEAGLASSLEKDMEDFQIGN